MEKIWNDVDAYFEERFVPSDDALTMALVDSAAAGLPAISVTASQGKLLQLLAGICHARRILEIGTLGGYSAIWMVRALPPDGSLISLEIDPGHAEVARRNLERALVADRVQIMVAPAVDSLARLAADHVDPFDLVFIDADKVNSDVYFRAALGLSHVGTVLVVDNVVRRGEVIDAQSADGNIQGIRRFTELLASEPRVSATAIQTVGSKGYDGLVLAVVTGPVGR